MKWYNRALILAMQNSIQKAFYYKTFQRYELLGCNVFMTWDNEMDFCGIRKSGYIDEIEMKISKADFLADFKKTSRIKSKYKCIASDGYSYDGYFYKNKHQALQCGELITNYFSFLVPKDLIDHKDIPDYAGIYEFIEGNNRYIIREVRKAPLLHKNKVSDHRKYNLARKMTYRYWQEMK